jgi:hypothetical protein
VLYYGDVHLINVILDSTEYSTTNRVTITEDEVYITDTMNYLNNKYYEIPAVEMPLIKWAPMLDLTMRFKARLTRLLNPARPNKAVCIATHPP